MGESTEKNLSGQKRIESKLIGIAREIANTKLASEGLTRDEIEFAAKLALKSAEENGDPYTLEEVQDPNSELRNLLTKFLRKRTEQRERSAYVLDEKGNVLGGAATRADAQKIIEEERRADTL